MESDELIRRLEQDHVVTIGREELAAVLEHAETIRDEETILAGRIRILSIEGRVVVQEETPDREVVVRGMDTRDAAERLVDRRLADYERMWDGCGCRIDYLAPANGE